MQIKALSKPSENRHLASGVARSILRRSECLFVNMSLHYNLDGYSTHMTLE